MFRITLFTMILFICSIGQITAQSNLLGKPYQPSLKQGTVIEHLSAINQKNGITLQFSPSHLNNQIVKLDGTEKTVGAVLQKVLYGQLVQAVEKNNKIILVPSKTPIDIDKLVPADNSSSVTATTSSRSSGLDYKTAAGVKFYPAAITVKHFVRTEWAIEAIASYSKYGARVTTLYEIHKPIQKVKGLQWYAGGGMHAGIWNDIYKKEYPDRDENSHLGIDAVIGLDYQFINYPLNISLDWQPSYNITGYSYFEPVWGGLSVRYIFK